ncbi:MAG: InlB B-repeat-containing protein [Spirochaetales bacterium]|nr:InlB B-repeat-containing protein [Spirochaetales bacterium]
MKKKLKIFQLFILIILSTCIVLSCNNDQSGTSVGAVDIDGDGIADGTAIDTNEDGTPDGIDTDGDGVIDEEWSDSYSILYYSVTYDGNGKDNGDVPVDSTSYNEGDTVTVAGNTGGLSLTDYIFNGWNSSADGSGTSYKEGDSITIGSADMTLYAQWKLAIDVYAAGITIDESEQYHAKYWKNGSAVSLDGAAASSIVVDEDDIHIVGLGMSSDEISGAGANSSGTFYFKYWKNGSAIRLSEDFECNPSSLYTIPSGIYVHNGTAYATGYQYDDEDNIAFARLWKIDDDNVTEITVAEGNSSSSSYAEDVFVDNNGVVYIAGEAQLNNSPSGYYVATLWKYDNGTITEVQLTDGAGNANAHSVYVNDGIVYVSGYKKFETDGGTTVYGPAIATYWSYDGATITTNVLLDTIPTQNNLNSEGESIFVNSDGVYIAGYDRTSSSTYNLKYWKDTDGTISDKTIASPSSYSDIRSICILKDDIYLAGFLTENSITNAVYWENGSKTDLSEGDTDSLLLSITAVEN